MKRPGAASRMRPAHGPGPAPPDCGNGKPKTRPMRQRIQRRSHRPLVETEFADVADDVRVTGSELTDGAGGRAVAAVIMLSLTGT
jgi:hypothetical protein